MKTTIEISDELLRQLVQRGLFRSVALVVQRHAIGAARLTHEEIAATLKVSACVPATHLADDAVTACSITACSARVNLLTAPGLRPAR